MMPCFFIAAPPHDTELNTQTSQQNCETTCVKLTIEFARHYTLQPELKSDISIGESATSHSEWINWYGYTGQGR